MFDEDNLEIEQEIVDTDDDLDVYLTPEEEDDIEDADDALEEETAAAETIKAKPSRSATLADIVASAANLSDTDLNHFADAIKKPSNPIGDGTASRNEATIKAKAGVKTVTKEELEELFGDDMSEEFREKVTTLFEAAVNTRVGLEVAAVADELEEKYAQTEQALEEAYASTLEDEATELTDRLYEQVDDYITLAATTWLEENIVAVDASLRADMAVEFMGRMKDLFVEHDLNITSEDEEILERVMAERDEAQELLNRQIDENIALKKGQLVAETSKVFSEQTNGLAESQIDRIRTLAEGIESDDLETFSRKLAIITEGVTKKTPASSGILTEEAPAVDFDQLNKQETPASNDPRMSAYIGAISRSVGSR